jgi:PqqD family protein of HPr-rel-A system
MVDRAYRSPLPPLVKEWDDGTMAYNPLTGATHRLDPISAEILQQILVAPRTRAELAALIHPDGPTTPDGRSVVDLVGAALDQMDKLGLVEAEDA